MLIKLDKGRYRVNRTTVYQNVSGITLCQAQAGQQVAIHKRVRGGYIGRLFAGKFVENILIKDDQVRTLGSIVE